MIWKVQFYSVFHTKKLILNEEMVIQVLFMLEERGKL